MATLTSFEELDCYRAARAFRISIAEMCRMLPREEEYRLKDQILRAARSVTANIAGGFGRHHHQENLQYCRQARGSLSECLDHLNCALDEKLIQANVYDELRKQQQDAAKILNGYIAYLQKAAKAK